MPVFIEPELAKPLGRPPAGPGWAHEIKLDGYRVQLRAEGGRAVLRTRKGLDWSTRFAGIAASASVLPDCILDGEVVVMDPQGLPDFSALQAALASGRSGALSYYAFDLLYLDSEDLRPKSFLERKHQLKQLLESHLGPDDPIHYLGHIESPGEAILRSACQMGLEGIVSKQVRAAYQSGRSGHWTKAKCRAVREVVIGGWTSTGGRLRSLVAGVYEGQQLMPVGRVGTGLGEDEVRLLMPRLKALASARSPFAVTVSLPGGRGVHWLKPELVAQIEVAGFTSGGHVRQASFKGLREDKPPREVQAEEAGHSQPVAAAPQRAARQAPPRLKPRVSHPAGTVLGVKISHPDKALWPDAGDGRAVTKWHLAEYYATVGEWMLPHVEGRPCSIIRAPDGIGGQRFFQRHAMPGMSKLLGQVSVAGDHEPYLVIDSVEALVAVAQAGGLELHPGNGEPGQPEVPGRLVFDLDPSPDVTFDTVVVAARELRERLAALGLVAFCKTTGGKGLHVVTPLEQPRGSPLDWPLVKAMAREVCAQMATDSPSRYLISMGKQARTGRIFLDYLRNDRLATAVAVLSPRASQGAPVSMPLTWAQVKSGLKPARFTLRTAPSMLQRVKPWADYAEAAQPVVPAIERLAGRKKAARPRR